MGRTRFATVAGAPPMVALVPILGSKPRPGEVMGPCMMVGPGVAWGGVRMRGRAGVGGVTTGVTRGVTVVVVPPPDPGDPELATAGVIELLVASGESPPLFLAITAKL